LYDPVKHRLFLLDECMEQLQHFRFNKAFLGTNGAHLEFGLTTPDPEEAALKALAIHCFSGELQSTTEHNSGNFHIAKFCSVMHGIRHYMDLFPN
jgi:DeoR/GlpR family transcriptional regulator of sugar metabolism